MTFEEAVEKHYCGDQGAVKCISMSCVVQTFNDTFIDFEIRRNNDPSNYYFLNLVTVRNDKNKYLEVIYRERFISFKEAKEKMDSKLEHFMLNGIKHLDKGFII